MADGNGDRTDDADESSDRSPDGTGGSTGDRPYELVDDERVVRVAAEAAEDLVFSRFDTADVADLDVTVTFEDGILEVDVYLNVPEPGIADPDRVADDAALAARRAVDELVAEAGDPDGT
ncbi:DUF3194 domain-containing protein [Halobacteriales archaeon QS_8_69_26]|nr:MAG: DUF3194 domain-containing protein [Halobacteriales archaeon QS_8_69_26]